MTVVRERNSEVFHRDALARRRSIVGRLQAMEDTLRAYFASSVPAQEQEAESFRPRLAEWRQTRARRVLVIDDTPAFADILTRLLTGLDLASEAVTSGERGIERARTIAYDLVIVDLSMETPGMLVVEELRRRSARPDVPILIVSGIASQEELEAVAKECGATAALAKPFDVEAFEAAVRRLLAPTVAGMALADVSEATDGRGH